MGWMIFQAWVLSKTWVWIPGYLLSSASEATWGTQGDVAAWMGYVFGGMDTCIRMAEFLHCPPEIITMTLLISYTSIQNKKFKSFKQTNKQKKSSLGKIITPIMTAVGLKWNNADEVCRVQGMPCVSKECLHEHVVSSTSKAYSQEDHSAMWQR